MNEAWPDQQEIKECQSVAEYIDIERYSSPDGLEIGKPYFAVANWSACPDERLIRVFIPTGDSKLALNIVSAPKHIKHRWETLHNFIEWAVEELKSEMSKGDYHANN